MNINIQCCADASSSNITSLPIPMPRVCQELVLGYGGKQGGEKKERYGITKILEWNLDEK